MCKTTTTSKGGEKPIEALPPPPFTIGDIKKAIPPHCFKRSLAMSIRYWIQDLIFVGIMGYFGYLLLGAPTAVQFVLWPVYWVVQGCFMTGLWVVAHECGHHAFSDYRAVDDFFGMITHSALLVPYHSWRISHANHHLNTGSQDNDEVFVPPLKSDLKGNLTRPSNAMIVVHAAAMEVFGWPLYLTMNATGPKKYIGKANSHFNPKSALFKDKDYNDIWWSDLGLVVALAVSAWAVMNYGFWAYFALYFVPLLNVNGWLVTITYLHHTDKRLPHYRGKEWSWLRGALSTVDRDYGWFLNWAFHNITDTHVAHHLFSKLPHYHAQEATKAIRGAIGKYYTFDDTPVHSAIFKSFQECRYVDDSEGDVLFFKG